jgi:hypothetical protein
MIHGNRSFSRWDWIPVWVVGRMTQERVREIGRSLESLKELILDLGAIKFEITFRFLVPGSWFRVPVPGFRVPGSVFAVRGAMFVRARDSLSERPEELHQK